MISVDMRTLFLLSFMKMSQLSYTANYESKDLKTFNVFGKEKIVLNL